VWLDINLSEEGAATWLTWLRDGLLLDDATRGMTVEAVTYNADLGVFALVMIEFDFGAGGSIAVGWLDASGRGARGRAGSAVRHTRTHARTNTNTTTSTTNTIAGAQAHLTTAHGAVQGGLNR